MNDSTLFMVVAGILAAILLVLSFTGSRTKKYRVVTSQPDPQTGGLVTEVLTRKWNDKYNDLKDMKCFHDDNGNLVMLGTHWIIKMEEVKG